MQADEYKMANSRTGANSDEDEKEQLLEPVAFAGAAAAEDGIRAADAQQSEQLVPEYDHAEAVRYRQFVIK